MTTNITNQFNNIATASNLHSFTSNELYSIGSPTFSPRFPGVRKNIDDSKEVTYELEENISKPRNDINVLIAGDWNDANGNSRVLASLETDSSNATYFGLGNLFCETDDDNKMTITRWYDIVLSPYDSTGLYQYYAKNGDPFFSNFQVTLTDTYDASSEEFNYFSNFWNNQYIDFNQSSKEKTVWKLDNLNELISQKTTPFWHDYEAIMTEVAKQQKTIFSQISTMSISPLQDLLDEKYGSEVTYQQFNSLNVTATSEKIFYKIIETNPSNQIDKVVLFEDKNHNTGYHLFDQNQWAPYGSEIKFYRPNGLPYVPKTVVEANNIRLIVPSDIEEVFKTPLYDLDKEILKEDGWSQEAKYLYAQIMHIRFKRMAAGQYSSSPENQKNQQLINDLAAINDGHNAYFDMLYQPKEENASDGIYEKYKAYFKDYYPKEAINFSANGTVVFNWVLGLGVPCTCTIANYTAFLSIVNPQHLAATNKQVISPEMFTSFRPFNVWCQATNHYDFNQQTVLDWLNWLTYDEFLFWKNPTNVKVQTYKIPTNGNLRSSFTSSTIAVTSDEWKGISQDYLIACGGHNLIIWGCGISADFMYPIVELTRPSPNATNECLVYLNNLGYQSIGLSFVNSPIEQFLLGKFRPHVSGARAAQIIDEINTWSKTNMIYPQNINSTYMNDDTNNILAPSGMRIAFVNEFIRNINIITIVLCAISIVIGLLICFIVIKKYIDKNRISVGIMRANGFNKWTIACSLLPFAILPAVAGGIIAYFFSFFLQTAMINIFSTYWVLPTPVLGFNVFSLLACVFIPFVFFSLISFLVTFNLLRNKARNLITSGSEYKANIVSHLAKRTFNRFGILTRFRASLAFSSLWRLAVLTLISTIAMCSLTFAISTFNKLNESHLADSSLYSYNFAVQLATPTASGGNYNQYDWINEINETGYGKANPQNYIFNATIPGVDLTPTQMIKPYNISGLNTVNAVSKKWNLKIYDDYANKELKEKEIDHQLADIPICFYDSNSGQTEKDLYQNLLKQCPNFLFITLGDSNGQKQDLFYLKDRFSSQTILDYQIGMGGMVANAWEIALALMPANNRNLALSSYDAIIQKVGEKIANAKPGDKWFLQEWKPSFASDWKDCYNDTFAKRNAFAKYIYQDPSTIGKQPKYLLNKSLTGLSVGDIKYYQKTNEFVYPIQPMAFNHEFLQLLLNIYSDPELCNQEYPINYGGTIPLNWDANSKRDETYTYINAKMRAIDSSYPFDSNKEINIIGLKDNSEYISLLDDHNNDLKNLFNQEGLVDNASPLIINSFVAHKYNLKVGNRIIVQITNSVDRFEKQIKQQNDDICEFKIVGITKGTANEKYYTSQYVANKLLGLPDGKSWNKTHKYIVWTEDLDTNNNPKQWSSSNLPAILDLANDKLDDRYKIYRFNKEQNKMQESWYVDSQHAIGTITHYHIPIGFNGVFTTQLQGKPNTNVLSLYSYTGMYPSISTFSSNAGTNKFAEILKQNNNLAFANFLTGLNDKDIYDLNVDMLQTTHKISNDQKNTMINQFIDKIVQVYGPTTVVTTINGAVDIHALDQVYENMITTFNTITNAILATIIPIAIVITILISNLVIDDSKKKAMMLKALGYNNWQNTSSFLSIYVPVIIIGLLLAIPISYGICLAYNAIIIQSTNLLVNSIPLWWHHMLSFSAISLTFGISYVYGYTLLRKERLVDNLKTE